MFFESPHNLPVELQQYISARKLKENRSQYEEFNIPLSPEDQERLKTIQRRLLTLPLVHCSRNPNIDELVAISHLAEGNDTNTYSFDRSLGLDKYVFLHWGLGDWAQYGRNLYCYSTELLLRPTTLVSQYDVLDIAIGREDVPYEQIPEEVKRKVQKYYFDLMLSGRDWFHLMSLRILKQLKQGQTMIPINYKTLGEIKILNRTHVSPSAAYHGRSDIEQNFYGEQMYPNGFIFQNIYENLMEGISSNVDPEPTPEQIQQIEQAWE